MTNKPRPAKLVIFDCDGVLVDSEPLSIRVLVETFRDLGVPLTETECYQHFLGRSLSSLKATVLTKFDRELTDAKLETMRERLYDLYRQELNPLPDMEIVLKTLSLPYCVASSSLLERIQLSLDLTGLGSFFGKHVFSSSMVANGKPAPDLFLYAASHMGHAPADCIVVEDSPAGIEAAGLAGMRAFAFVGGSHAAAARLRETVAAKQPYCIFERMAELPALIANMSQG